MGGMAPPWERGDLKFACQCALCVRGREFDRRIKRLSPDTRAFFEALYDSLNHVEFELDWLKSANQREANIEAEGASESYHIGGSAEVTVPTP